MTIAEGLISNGTGRIPGTRYGDYSKIDVDPSDDSTFWFINEYYKSGRKGVVGAFQIQAGPPDEEPPTDPTNLTASNITSSGATLSWNASTDNVGVEQYNVSIDGNLVGTTSSTSFDVTDLSPLTNYIASVNAEDAAGNMSGDVTTSFTTLEGGGNNGEIAAYYFETGWQGWTDGGNDCQRQSTSNSYEGSYSIKLRDDSSTSNAVSPIIDLSGNSQVSIEFHTYTSGFDTGENYFVEFYNGTSFQTIGTYTVIDDFNNGSFFTDTIVLDSGTYSFNSDNRIRIRCNASANNDQMWFDQVIITGDAAASAPIASHSKEEDGIILYTQNTVDNIKLYPNPTNSQLNIEIFEGQFDEISIFSSSGMLIQSLDTTMNKVLIDVSQYATGMYFVRFISNGYAVTKRFIKK
jgi:hypothetical protein